MPAPAPAFDRLVSDNDALRELIQRWRSTPGDAAELFGRASRMWRATTTAKHRRLYPAVQRQVPEREPRVQEAIRASAQVNGFLAAAERIGPDGPGFLDQVSEAAAAADALLIHERRDIFPAVNDDDAWPGGAAVRIVDEYLALRDRTYDALCDEQPVEERWARMRGAQLPHGMYDGSH